MEQLEHKVHDQLQAMAEDVEAVANAILDTVRSA